jgi:glycosyltransferase involved in cell wall biosynthesis
MKKTKLFIEAVPLVEEQISGVPHSLAGLVAALAANEQVQKKFEIVLVAPGSRLHLLDRWRGLEGCTRKAIPMKFRIMNGLGRRGLLPPMDLLLGKGVYLFGNFFNWPLTKRSRSFTYIHDICFALHPEFVHPENQRMLAKNVPRFIKQTNYILTVSESAREEIINYFNVPAKQVVVLHNGVDTELYRPYPGTEVETVKAKYGLAGRPYFLFVGNIEPRKNLERLVAAMRQLSKEYALLLVGSDGWLNDKVFAAIAEANNAGHTIVKPKVYVPDGDVARLMSGALSLVQPSLYEGFGMPPLEAMVSRTLVVVTDIPPLHEVAGQAGIYCDPYKPEAIADAMQRVIQMSPDKREEHIAAGLAQAKQFTWQKSAARLAHLLESLEL